MRLTGIVTFINVKLETCLQFIEFETFVVTVCS